MRRTISWLIAILSTTLLIPANAQTVKVMSSGGTAAAYSLLAPQFEKEKGAHLDTVWGPSMGNTAAAIPARLARGESANVVIMARSALDELVKQGQVVAGSQVDLVHSRIGMAVKAGTPIPDINTVDAFRKTLLQAKSVAYSDSSSGVYISNQLFKRLGIESDMAAKSKQIPGDPVGGVVATGQFEIGFQQLSELQPVSGITIVGPIPDELQQITVFSAGIVANAPNPDGGRALIRFLASSEACDAFRQSRLDPLACPAEEHSTNSTH